MRKILLALALVLTACSGGNGGKDDTNESDDTAGGGDDTGGTAPDVAPRVVSIDNIECTEQQSAGEVWQTQITVTDPQGNDTIASGTVYVRNEAGGELADYMLACGDGSCTGSFRADYDGITCSLEGTLTMAFQVEDEDGNLSAEKSQAAR